MKITAMSLSTLLINILLNCYAKKYIKKTLALSSVAEINLLNFKIR